MYDRPVIYSAIGDSLTVGIGAFLAPGFVKRYADYIQKQTGRLVHVRNHGKNGATSAYLVYLFNDPAVAFDVSRAEVLTLTVGGNDLRYAVRLFQKTKDARVFAATYDTFQKNLQMILRRIVFLKKISPFPYLIRMVDIYNPFPEFPALDRWIRQFNEALYRWEQMIPHFKVARVYSAFRRSLASIYSFDGIHPNNTGYEIIARELRRLGVPEIAMRKKEAGFQ